MRFVVVSDCGNKTGFKVFDDFHEANGFFETLKMKKPGNTYLCVTLRELELGV